MKKTIGRVVGPLGFLLVAFSLLTYLFITREFDGLVWVELLLGLLGIGFFAATAFDDVRNIATGRGTVFVATSAVMLAVVVGALAAVNYWAKSQEKEWDFTATGIHTLAEQTQSLLKKLTPDTKVTVYAFYANDPQRPFLEHLLHRYALVGRENFDFEFVDVYRQPQLAKQFNVTQASPRIILKSANGKEARVKEISEQALTNGLAELGRGADRTVYFLSGHGEKPLVAGADSAVGLQVWKEGLEQEGFKTQELSLLTTKDVPEDAAALVIAGPQTPFTVEEKTAVEAYADRGGSIAVFLDPGVETGLEELVAGWGAVAMPGVILDTATRNPLMAVTQEFSDHPISLPKMSILGAMPFTFVDARGVKAGRAQGYEVVELFKTGARAWAETDPLDPTGETEAFPGPNDTVGPVPMGVAITKKDGEQEFRAVVLGDSDFASNQFIRQNGNRDLALNVVQWLGGSSDEITIRPKLRAKSTIAALTQDNMKLLAFGSLNILPLLLIGLGLSVWSTRKSK